MKIVNSITAALLLLFLTHAARALDPTQPFSSYIRTDFTNRNGLPNDIVNKIVQSRDGFLWLTLGNSQLARFDGQRFTTLPISNANQMAIGPDGDLWVATGTELKQLSAAALNQFGPLQAISHGTGLGVESTIINLHFSRNGLLWVGTNHGLYRFEHGVFSLVIPQLSIQRIEESPNGDLLLTTGDGFMVWNGSRAVPHPEIAAQLGIKANDIFHVLEDSRGVTWIATGFGVARRVGTSVEKLQPWGPNHGLTRIYEDSQGNVWVDGDEGLFRATTNGLEPALTGLKVWSMYGDRDGNLWVGTDGNGLIRFKDRPVRTFTTADGLPGNVPMTVLTTHDGTLWAGFNCGGLVHFDGHTFRTYNEKDGLLNSCVWSLAEDTNNDLWIGTYGGGIFRFRNGGFTQYGQSVGLPTGTVTSVLRARDGSLWLGTAIGISRLRNGQHRNYTRDDGVPFNQMTRLYEDRRGGIWFGSPSGLYRFDGDRFVNVPSIPNIYAFPIGDDDSGGLYVSLYSNEDSSGNSNGLFRFENDRLIKLIPDVFPITMAKTRQGDLWLSGDGILRVPPNRLEQLREHDEPLDFTSFGIAEGMTSIQTSTGYPVLAFTSDGKLWVATVQGLVMLDLPHLPTTDRKPTIYMKEFTVGRNQQLPGQQLVLPVGTSHVELHFDAIEIMSPEKIRMQYRMDGVDSEWLDVKPPGHAVYSTIPPGTHAFHVRACNRDGIWDRTGMVYLIIQKPFFYQTTWFRLAVIATVLLMVAGLYRLRLSQAKTRLNALFDERLAERTRIARELHDTLLQTIQGSKLVADDALEKYDAGVPVRTPLQKLSDWLGQATQEGRAALNSLRISTIDTNDLAAGLRRATEECRVSNSIDVAFSVTGGPRDMHPIARDEIYRIGYEAIRNACEHSSASELEIILTYAQDFTLQVKDNGAGIEATVLTDGKAGHFGLQGMRERAARIGSKVTLNSAPDSGTEMTLVVPGNVIYRKSSVTRFTRLKDLFWQMRRHR
jgi:signal transduction histidine kinase/ligand-binding sensor domain-containing protein